MTARRLELTAHGDPAWTVELARFEEPAPGPDEVLVAMEAAPLNPSDFMLVDGRYRVRPSFPFALGAEGAGRVAARGAGVDTPRVGERVLIVPNHQQGTWADRVVVAAKNIVPCGDDADPVQLSMIGINAATAHLLLSRYVSLMPGDWIGQTAANSAMGEYIARLARLAGVRTLNVVRRADAAEHVRRVGGDVVVQGENPHDLHEGIGEALGDARLRLVLDCLGGPVVGELATWLETGGPVACYGVRDGRAPELSPHDVIFRSLSLHGVSIGNWLRDAPVAEIHRAYRALGGLVADGSLHATVDSVYPLERYQEAFARSQGPGRTGKVLFDLRGAPRM